MIFAWVWAISATVVCGAALWKGGPSERAAGAIYYVSWVATLLLHDPNRDALQWGVTIVDTATFLLLSAVALRSDRHWPMFMAGFTLLALVTHLGRLIDTTMGAWAYFTAALIWGYLALYALGYGAWTAWRRRQLAKAGAPAGATLR